MEVEGDRLYLFDYHKGTWVFDLSDPLKPVNLNRPAQLYDGLSAATAGTLAAAAWYSRRTRWTLRRRW